MRICGKKARNGEKDKALESLHSAGILFLFILLYFKSEVFCSVNDRQTYLLSLEQGNNIYI